MFVIFCASVNDNIELLQYLRQIFMITFLNILYSIAVIIFSFMLLVGIHEFGHFLIARLVGVKVLCFSFGFGKILYRFKDKLGTEFAISAIPLGGYVRLLDEREAAVPVELREYAFNRQPIYKRTAIIIAGPLFNLILAFMIYWASLTMGVMQIVPTIGEIKPKSIAELAGMHPSEEIINVDGHNVQGWPATTLRIIQRLGHPGILTITTIIPKTQTKQTYQLKLTHWSIGDLNPEPVESLGIVPLKPPMPAQFAMVLPNSPAAQAGLKANDLVMNVNGKTIKNWEALLTLIEHSPGQNLLFGVQRNKQSLTINVTIGSKTTWYGKTVGFIGVKDVQPQWPPNSLRIRQYPFYVAWLPAAQEVYFFTEYNLVVLQKMLSGVISLKSLGGPISIFQGTLIAANHGIIAYLVFVAFISICLGIINLLPIPGLDGSQLIYFLIEKIRGGKPVSLAVQLLLFRLGVIALILLLFQGMINDLMRL